MKVCPTCNNEIDTTDKDNKRAACDSGKRPPKKKRRTRKQMDDLMASLGMTRVRGAMGGTYYE